MQPNTFLLVRELAFTEPVSMRVRGTCMLPLLQPGATLSVRARFAFPGDVIVFRTPAGELAVHRLLGWRRAGLVTKGDHADGHDAPVRCSQVIGVAEVPVSAQDRLRAVRDFVRIAGRKLLR